MRGLTSEMDCEFQKYLDQVQMWMLIDCRARGNAYNMRTYDKENLLPKENKTVLDMVPKLLEFYSYTDIKESITLNVRTSHSLTKNVIIFCEARKSENAESES